MMIFNSIDDDLFSLFARSWFVEVPSVRDDYDSAPWQADMPIDDNKIKVANRLVKIMAHVQHESHGQGKNMAYIQHESHGQGTDN